MFVKKYRAVDRVGCLSTVRRQYLTTHFVYLQEDGEDIGELYQDEENGAALLIRRHPKHGKLMVVSTHIK